MTTLVLAPHTDDAELGCGGTIAKLMAQGERVVVAVVSDAGKPGGPSSETLREECLRSLSVFGCGVAFGGFHARDLPRQKVLEWMLELRDTLAPDTVLLPAQSDLHQDHHVVAMEGLRAFKDRTVLGYELPWNDIEFRANWIETLTAENLTMKWQALTCYASQSGRHYFNRDKIWGWAAMRGMCARAEYAEAYEVMRVVR